MHVSLLWLLWLCWADACSMKHQIMLQIIDSQRVRKILSQLTGASYVCGSSKVRVWDNIPETTVMPS